MTRLVDADALIKEANADGAYGYVSAADISNAPTIDAEPVRHGRWIHTDMAASWKPSCRDECGECHYHDKDHRDLSDFKFCPMCGVKMDGGDEDGEC